MKILSVSRIYSPHILSTHGSPTSSPFSSKFINCILDRNQRDFYPCIGINILTSDGPIEVLISDEQSCCEIFGCYLSINDTILDDTKESNDLIESLVGLDISSINPYTVIHDELLYSSIEDDKFSSRFGLSLKTDLGQIKIYGEYVNIYYVHRISAKAPGIKMVSNDGE